MKRLCLAGLLGLALSLTVATQLRPAGIRIGAAEAILAVFLLLVLMRFVSAPVPIFRDWVAQRLGAGLLLCGGFLTLGILWGTLTGRADFGAWTSGVAYMFAVLVLWAAYAASRIGWISGLDLVYSVSIAAVVGSTLFLALPSLGVSLVPCSLWYEGDVLRFMGCSENPNQLALLLVTVPFIMADAFVNATHGIQRCFVAFVVLLGLALGAATGSDALVAGLLGGAAALVLDFVVRRKIIAWRLIGLGVLALIPLAAGFLLIGQEQLTGIFYSIETSVNTNDQASTRLSLSLGAVDSILSSWFFGFGPGAFSLPDAEGVRLEAHNTLLDWGTQSGVGGMFALTVIALLAAHKLLRSNRPWLLAALAALLTFSMFHFVLRQPVFWILFLLPVLVLPDCKGTSSSRAVLRSSQAAVEHSTSVAV